MRDVTVMQPSSASPPVRVSFSLQLGRGRGCLLDDPSTQSGSAARSQRACASQLQRMLGRTAMPRTMRAAMAPRIRPCSVHRLRSSCRPVVAAGQRRWLSTEPRRPVSEGVESVQGVELAYSRCGSGPAVLCIPGAMGTASTDFEPQLQALSASHTVIAFDPRGYGRSRPPARDFPDGFYERDARDGAELMRALGLAEHGYSVLGWSDGANSAVHLAACFPDEVRKLVVWGANTRLNQDDIDAFNATRDVQSTWSKRQRETMSAVYGLEGLQHMWSAACDAWERIVVEGDGNVCGAEAALVRCPTFVLHGANDPMVYPEHPRELVETIGPSRFSRPGR